MDIAYVLFAGALAILAGSALWRWIAERRRLLAMTPDERNKYTLTKAFGSVNDQLLCQHCNAKGTVRSKEAVRQEARVVKTGNLIRHTHETSVSVNVTRFHCDNCGTTWDV